MPAVAVSWDSHYSSMDKYHQNSMNLMTNIGGVHSTTSGIHMSSPAYLPSPFTTTTGASFTNSTSGGDSYLPRAPNSFSYPSPSFESYTTNASTFTHGYTSSASSSTAPLSSPDGYYGVPAYPQTWEPENLDAIKQEAAQQTAGGPMKTSPRRRQKAPKTSSERLVSISLSVPFLAHPFPVMSPLRNRALDDEPVATKLHHPRSFESVVKWQMHESEDE